MRRVGLIVLAVVMLATAAPAGAAEIGTDYYGRTWARTDKPVADGLVNRTWMWGPEGFTNAFLEQYDNSPAGVRLVQYFDKSRMEITHPEGDANSSWYVTNGLLVLELISGRMQLGDSSFEQRLPAQVNVAGDPDDLEGPTYASFTNALKIDGGAQDAVITRGIRRDSGIFDNQAWASYGVRETVYAPETRHWIAGPFWDFMTSAGLVYENGDYAGDSLFENAFYATGFPVTDAYWATVAVGGVKRDVLMQCFERRCLTYTPDNPPGWRVEAGNVGQHYFRWRYGTGTQPAIQTANVEITGVNVTGDVAGESVSIRNNGAEPVQMASWLLWDRTGQHAYAFPEFTLHPGATATVHNCNGDNSGSDLYAGFCQPWWSADDYALLLDATSTLVDFRGVGGG